MALVVLLVTPVRPDEIETVHAGNGTVIPGDLFVIPGLTGNLQRDAPCDRGMQLRRLGLHPAQAGRRVVLDRGVRQGREARGEHLGQDVQVGLGRAGQQRVQMNTIRLGITPGDIVLDQTDLH